MMRLIRRLLLGILLAAIPYVGLYVYLSGFPHSGTEVWSFHPPPAGLMRMDMALRVWQHEQGMAPPGDPDPWDEWREAEGRHALIFSPCIWLDGRITGRPYLLWYKGGVCFN